MFHIGMRGRAIGAAAVAALATMGMGVQTAEAGVVGIWEEVGDAGQNGVGAAQETFGTGPLAVITGSLSDRNDVDIFCIHITNEAIFRAQVTSFAGTDPVLWLFNANGTLQVFNDDFGGLANSTITSQGVLANGTYYLGISRYANAPLNAADQDLQTAAAWPGPDTGQIMGNANILHHWNNDTFPGDLGGPYSIDLRGAEFCPTPGAAVLLGMGGLVAARRRR